MKVVEVDGGLVKLYVVVEFFCVYYIYLIFSGESRVWIVNGRVVEIVFMMIVLWLLY